MCRHFANGNQIMSHTRHTVAPYECPADPEPRSAGPDNQWLCIRPAYDPNAYSATEPDTIFRRTVSYSSIPVRKIITELATLCGVVVGIVGIPLRARRDRLTRAKLTFKDL